MEELDRIYRRYKKATNMTYSELLDWSMTECSRKASLDKSPLKRNLKLLRTPKSRWTGKHIRWAKKTISYLARAKKIKSRNYIKECGRTKNSIALKNWAFDIKQR